MLMKSEHRKELVSEIRSLAQSQGLNTVFTTFLEITANSLAAQTDPENTEKREQRYQEMASTMTPELLSSYDTTKRRRFCGASIYFWRYYQWIKG